MFGIFKSKYNLINSGLMKGMTDVHSHVLPGVDDGSPDINASLSLLRYMESIGLRKVWLTPHIMEDYPTPNKKLRQQLDVLKAAYSGPLDLRLSSEYMMEPLLQTSWMEKCCLWAAATCWSRHPTCTLLPVCRIS